MDEGWQVCHLHVFKKFRKGAGSLELQDTRYPGMISLCNRDFLSPCAGLYVQKTLKNRIRTWQIYSGKHKILLLHSIQSVRTFGFLKLEMGHSHHSHIVLVTSSLCDKISCQKQLKGKEG